MTRFLCGIVVVAAGAAIAAIGHITAGTVIIACGAVMVFAALATRSSEGRRG